MDNKNSWEIYTKYSKEFPYWVINEENKPTREAFDDFYYNKMISYDDNLFRYSERTFDRLTIISKDPDIKYIWMDRTSSAPLVQKPFLYTETGYYLEKVSFYATGVWKMEFKRDTISLWIQFLENIRENSEYGDRTLKNIRTLTTRTNLINDNYQFEDEKLKELPLKINGWNREELTPSNNIITKTTLANGLTTFRVNYNLMTDIWSKELITGFKIGEWSFTLGLVEGVKENTSFQEYYVFNTEEFGMVYIPKVEFIKSQYVSLNYREELDYCRLYYPRDIEKYLVNNKWASQFLGIFILPNWLTTSVDIEYLQDIEVSYQENGQTKTFTFSKLAKIPFSTNTNHIMTINYQIPSSLKVDITKNKKLNVKDKLVSFSTLQVLPIHLNYINGTINLQKYPQFFDLENNIMRFKYDFIFSGVGVNTYQSKYETIENWLKTLPGQLPSSTSKFAQYIQANQNVLQTGIWVKQEEAKLNQLNAFANAAVGAGAATAGVFGMVMGNPMMGFLGAAHGMNQAIQGATNYQRAENEVKFEKARVKAKYADTFNSSTRQINYAQSIDALSKEFLEARVCDVLIYPIIENIEIYNDVIVRSGNKTYEYFKLNELITISENNKYNYFELSSENFYKETTNYQKIWEHFTYEEISLILDWLEKGVRLWKTSEVEYDYQE